MESENGVVAKVAMRGVSKRFGAAKVLHEVDLEVYPGEIHGLVGQNGAGKSTLVKILGGVYPDYQGSIAIDGEEVHFATPRHGVRAGVGMIYQELSLIPGMTVAENLVLGDEPGRIRYSRRAVRRRAADLLERIGVFGGLPLDQHVGHLSAGLQQQAEIAKALTRDASVLVMDEPTARLSALERTQLLALMKELAVGGLAIIYISHFLEELFEVTDRVTVLRNGRVVARAATKSFGPRRLTETMLSEELVREELSHRHRGRASSASVVLEARDLAGGQLRDVTIAAHQGEILGLGGLVGSGRTKLARALVGVEPLDSGEIRLHGKAVRLRGPRDALARGIVLVPKDRKADGIVGTRSAAENLVLTALDRGLARRSLVRRREARRQAEKMIVDLGLHPPDPDLPAAMFSGGNQQKLLIGRALLARPDILIVDQPTAGVDVGAKAQIHRILRDVAAGGTTILVISDDLEELLALSDRVAIMHAGTVVSTVDVDDFDRQALIDAISGSRLAA